ncbi:MAG: hypothetical protein M1835_005718 [Candelina submexicana]|nr:MAG: hypothetical protein M1835_005718 [Candelina submexicana]
MTSSTTTPQASKADEDRQAAAEADLQRRREATFAERSERERPWKARLIGKRLVDKPSQEVDEKKEFSFADLPTEHRIIKFGDGEWCDEVGERLTIYLDEHGAVESLRFG